MGLFAYFRRKKIEKLEVYLVEARAELTALLTAGDTTGYRWPLWQCRQERDIASLSKRLEQLRK